MTLGTAPRQGDLLRTTANYCSGRVAEDSIYGVLHRECFSLFPDEMFADLFTDVGRRSVPPMIVAVVMVLQRRSWGCQPSRAMFSAARFVVPWNNGTTVASSPRERGPRRGCTPRLTPV